MRDKLKTLILNIILFVISIIMLFPLAWIIITSLKSQIEILREPLALIPSEILLYENLLEVLSRAPWMQYFINSVLIVLLILLAQLVTSILAAYAFAYFNFRGKTIFFIMVLMRLMISPDSVILPNYMTILNLGLIDTRLAIGLPYVGSAMAILILRQSILQIPTEIKESAKMDGCGDLLYIYKIVIPLIKPAILTFSIISVVYHWNAYFWPMLVTETPSSRTLPVGLAQFGLQAETGAEWALTMAAALIVITPLLIAFIIFQKQFINSFLRSGLK